MLNHTLPSIEEFAAFLDGNLSQDDMQQFSRFAAHNGALHQLLNANSAVDKTLNGLTDTDLQLPLDLVGADFELPVIPSEDTSAQVSLISELFDDRLVAVCAADVSMFSDVNQDDHTTMGEEMHDDSSLSIPDSDVFDNNDDLSGSSSDNIY